LYRMLAYLVEGWSSVSEFHTKSGAASHGERPGRGGGRGGT